MKRSMIVFVLLATVGLLAGCGTSTRFVLPEGTRIYLPAKDMTFAPGKAKARPFFWGSFGGIDYQLLKDGKPIKEGRLESDFRVTSLFWPPLAIIYWPVGFEWNCYDMTGPEPVMCNR